jgi:RimJ/RimL family protein N-acetyltransferase
MSNMPQPGTMLAAGAPLLRRMLPEDRGALAAHLLSLSPWDRVARWNGARSDAAIREECDALDLSPDSRRALTLGAVGPRGVVGAAICIRLPGAAAELAVTIAEAWRCRGLGTALVRLAWSEAQAALGATRAILEVDAENIPMLRLRRRLAAEIALGHAGAPRSAGFAD